MTTHLPLTVWPFALYVAFPRSDYYGHADAAWGIGGFGITFVLPSLALLAIPMSLSHVHSHGLKRDHVGGSYLSTSTCYCRLLSGHGVDQVRPCHSFAALRGLTASRWE